MFINNLVSIVNDLYRSLPDIEALAAVSDSDFLAPPMFPAGVDKDRCSTLCSAMLAWGEKTLQELAKGPLEQMLLKGSGGYVVLSAAGKNTILVVLTASDSGLEEIQRAAHNIAALPR